MRRLPLLVGAAAVALSFTACRPDSVRIAFRPAEGARYRYQVDVRSVATTRVEGQPANREENELSVGADHVVLEVGADGSRVQVRLRTDGTTPRTFVVRLDRAAQLAEVQRVEGLPARVLGDLGLAEIFPAAAGAPPDRELAPGDRWSVNEPVRLPGLQPTRLRGSGRLVALGVVNGHKVATVQSTVRLPVTRTTEEREGRVRLVGTQTTTSTATHALEDGAVQEVRAVTRARFQLTLLPPDGGGGAPVPGTLELEVRSHTRRRG